METELKKHIKEKVVLDTRSSWIYIGTLDQVTGQCAVLTDVDVHDNTDTATSKDRYVCESRDTGIKTNRDRVFVSIEYIVSFSLLEDVKNF
ncbi:MAG: hypothetical protein K8R67_11200 [Desulfobacteraceae bacterium]|nr:hypothetical protein [Desulfobacteraceae bacterium]